MGVSNGMRIKIDNHAFLVEDGIGPTPTSCLLTKAKSPSHLDKVASFYIVVRK
jgi:hypothetical protein